MKRLFALICLLGSAPLLHAQRVILDFEKGYPEDQFFFLTYNAESRLELRANPSGFIGKSTRATWRMEIGPGRLGYVGFGYFHSIAAPANPFPDLTGYSHLSLWYNNTTKAAGAEHITFRFELYEREAETDGSGASGLQVWIFESRGLLAAPTGWTQLLMPLSAVPTIGDAGFAIPEGSFAGDGVLDLDKIRHWGVVLVADDVEVGTVFSGVTLFDYLAAEQRATSPADPLDTPLSTALDAPYPNPFATELTLTYTLARPAEASVRVYDLLGREVAVPVPARPHDAGPHVARFTGADLAAGVYVCVLTAEGRRFTQIVTRLP